MAFRIQSIEQMKEVARKMSDCATTAQTTTDKVISNIEVFVSSISGKGVDSALSTLQSAVTSNTQKMVSLLNDISTFISTQTSSYESNEDNAATSLNDVQNALDAIII